MITKTVEISAQPVASQLFPLFHPNREKFAMEMTQKIVTAGNRMITTEYDYFDADGITVVFDAGGSHYSIAGILLAIAGPINVARFAEIYPRFKSFTKTKTEASIFANPEQDGKVTFSLVVAADEDGLREAGVASGTIELLIENLAQVIAGDVNLAMRKLSGKADLMLTAHLR